MPQPGRANVGRHSYTIMRGSAKLEVLLKNRAFYIRSPDSARGQITWSKHGGVKSAWISACTKAGVLP